MRVAEAEAVEGGNVRYVIEYEREGFGTQRPTFVFSKDMSFDECAKEMREAIEEQERLNAKPKASKSISKLVGKEI